MSEEDDLARRFFLLWAEYLAGLAADPQMSELLRRWVTAAAGAPQNGGAGDACTGDRRRPAAEAAAAAGASLERDAAVAELARRVDELHERVAALERKRRPLGGARRRDRPARP